MPDIFNYAGEVQPNDIRLSDPTQLRGGGVSLVLSCGSFSLSGSDASVSISKTEQLSNGGFTLAGGDIQIQIARQVQLSNGSFALTGGVVQTLIGRFASLESGSFNFSGQPVGTVVARTLTANTEVLSLIGSAVVITPSGQPVPPVPPVPPPITGGGSFSGERKKRKATRAPKEEERDTPPKKAAPKVERDLVPELIRVPSLSQFLRSEIPAQSFVFNPPIAVDDEDSDMAVAIAVLEIY